jgi:hypothetical protein
MPKAHSGGLAGFAAVLALCLVLGLLVRSTTFPPAGSPLHDILRARSAAAAAAVAAAAPPPPGRPLAQPSYLTPPLSAAAAPRLDAAAPWPPAFEPFPAQPRVYDLRACECTLGGARYAGRFEGAPELGEAAEGEVACFCPSSLRAGAALAPCPPHVTLDYLTEAPEQDFCTLQDYTGYAGCSAECTAEQGGAVTWTLGQRCAVPGAGGGSSGSGSGGGAPALPPCPPLLVPFPHWRMRTRPAASQFNVNNQPPPPVTWEPSAVVDLRGLQCELHPGSGGRERCFVADAAQGRILCPAHVTSAYLRAPPTEGPHALSPDMAEKCSPAQARRVYCTVSCQPGNERAVWQAHDIAWCYSRENAWACPSMRPEALVPAAQFAVAAWSEPSPSPLPCHAAAAAGVALPRLEGITLAILTHEPVAFRASMASYEERGLFDLAVDFVVYLNQRSPALEAIVAEHAARHPGLIRVLGTAANVGIAAGVVELVRAAKQPHVLFLERDFWLVEPGACVVQQLLAGVALLATGRVHVVRYRHRVRAGRPNWAEDFYRGHEDDVFTSAQPNLACNLFYWVPEPHKRWPDAFEVCGASPQFLCSDSADCNWTNNPQLFSVQWWREEYEPYLPTQPKDDIGAHSEGRGGGGVGERATRAPRRSHPTFSLLSLSSPSSSLSLSPPLARAPLRRVLHERGHCQKWRELLERAALGGGAGGGPVPAH